MHELRVNVLFYCQKLILKTKFIVVYWWRPKHSNTFIKIKYTKENNTHQFLHRLLVPTLSLILIFEFWKFSLLLILYNPIAPFSVPYLGTNCKMYIWHIPVAKPPTSWGTAVCSSYAGSARGRSPQRRLHTILQSDQAGELSDQLATSARSSCDRNDAKVAPFHSHRALEYPAMKGSGRRLPRTWHLQNNFIFVTCRSSAGVLGSGHNGWNITLQNF